MIPWFLLTVGVLVWRLIKGWRSLFHLLAFGLAALTMVIMEEALVTRDVAPGIARAWGGTVLLTAGYWAFFDKVRDGKALRSDDQAGTEPITTSEDWSERLLIGVLVLQVTLEFLVYAELTPVPWFQLLYGAHLIAVAVLATLAIPPLRRRTIV